MPSSYVWLIVGFVIVVQIVAVTLEKGEAPIGRREFGSWLFYFLTAALILGGASQSSSNSIASFGPPIVWTIFSFVFYQSLTRRSVDAGFGKWLAYIAVIPLLNFLCILILLVVPTRTGRSNDQPQA